MAAAAHSAKLTASTLEHINELSEQAQRLLNQQQHHNALVREATTLDELKRELGLLRRRKAELGNKLRQRSLASTLNTSATASYSPSSDALQLAVSLQERVSAAAERNAKRSKVCEVQIAYRVAGHSVFPLSATRSGIRFETCYNGTYYEQYYVILDLATEQGKIFRHTLPPFVPLRELTPYVSKDLARFISAVDDYLNAFVARRVQIVDLAQTASLVLGGEPEASPSFNNVRFTVVVAPLPDSGNDMSEEEGEEEEDEMGLPVARDAHGQRSVKYLVHLRYNDLLSTLPDAVTIRAAGQKDDARNSALRRAEKAFMTYVPAVAIRRAFVTPSSEE